MLIQDMFMIEEYIHKLVNELKQTPFVTDVTSYNNEFDLLIYFVNKSNITDYFSARSISYYKRKGYFTLYSLFRYYYNCKEDTLVKKIKDDYIIFDDSRYMKKYTIEKVINDNTDKKYNYVILEPLFKFIVMYYRNIFKTIIKTKDFDMLSYLNNLLLICDKLLGNINFYIAVHEYDIFSVLYKDYTFNISYKVRMFTDSFRKSDITKVLSKYIKFIERQAKKYFEKNLSITKFLFTDYSYFIRHDNVRNYELNFVFHVPNLGYLPQLFIISDLCENI